MNAEGRRACSRSPTCFPFAVQDNDGRETLDVVLLRELLVLRAHNRRDCSFARGKSISTRTRFLFAYS